MLRKYWKFFQNTDVHKNYKAQYLMRIVVKELRMRYICQDSMLVDKVFSKESINLKKIRDRLSQK